LNPRRNQRSEFTPTHQILEGIAMRPIAIILIALLLAPAYVWSQDSQPAPQNKVASKSPPSSKPLTQAEKDKIDKDNAAAGAAGAAILGVGILFWIVMAILSLLWVCIPVIIALMRGHPNTPAIAAVSLLLGWCLIGWVWALIWSLTTPPHMHGGVYKRRD
jgi:hypothetical protein